MSPDKASTLQKKKAFLEHYLQLYVVGKAAVAAGISHRTVIRWKQEDPDFRADYDAAQQTIVEILEREAIRRAYEGVEEPVFQGGKEVGRIRKFSDTLLIFLLKGLAPHKYRERYEVTSEDGAPVTFRVVYEQPEKAAVKAPAG